MRIFGITGRPPDGRAGLTERLAAEIAGRGVTVSTVKQTAAGFDIDQPGRDSQRHRAAGATEVILAADIRWAMMHELRGAAAPGLADHLARLAPVDLVLVEGFADAPHPKLRIGADGAAADDPMLRALVDDQPGMAALPRFAPGDVSGIAGFILAQTGLDADPGA